MDQININTHVCADFADDTHHTFRTCEHVSDDKDDTFWTFVDREHDTDHTC